MKLAGITFNRCKRVVQNTLLKTSGIIEEQGNVSTLHGGQEHRQWSRAGPRADHASAFAASVIADRFRHLSVRQGPHQSNDRSHPKDCWGE